MDVVIPEGFIGKFIKQKSPRFITYRIPFKAGRFTKDSPAEAAGMQLEDQIIGINDKPLTYFSEIFREVTSMPNETVVVNVLRGQDTLAMNVTLSDQGKMGVFPLAGDHYFNYSEKSYGFFEAIPKGCSLAYIEIGNYFKQLKLIFSPEVKAYESVGGFITIGSIFPKVWDWHAFWRLTALLSIMLAILNVLPIPALDGGHTMFLLYEIISGRKPNDKFMEYAQMVGMIILFGLLIFANGNDILKLFK